MNKSNLPFNRPLFTQNAFFNQRTFASQQNATTNATGTPTAYKGKDTTHAQTSENRPHTGENKQHGSPHRQATKQTAFEPTRFNMNHKPDPVSFYARYGITLKGKQTNVKCCFHGDKTPSLSINKDTGAFYCFGCGVSGGDVIDFYQLYHKCDFISACQELNISHK